MTETTVKRPIGRPRKDAPVDGAPEIQPENPPFDGGILVFLDVPALLWVEDQAAVLGTMPADVLANLVHEAVEAKPSDPVPARVAAAAPVSSHADMMKDDGPLTESAEQVLAEMIERLKAYMMNNYHNKFCRDFYEVMRRMGDGEGVPLKPEW